MGPQHMQRPGGAVSSYGLGKAGWERQPEEDVPGRQRHAEQDFTLQPTCPVLTPALCVQELQELERKLEDQLAHQEAAKLQRVLASRQQWAGEEPGLLHQPEETDSERQISAVLQQALSKGQKVLEHRQQR